MTKLWKNFKDRKYWILLIILVAVFFRFWQLGSVPPGLYPDIATNGTDAITANQTLDYKIFYPANNGREGLFINLIAFSFKLFGVGLWQLRLVGAILGVLTVFGVYLLTKEFFEERAALFASFFMATGFWAVNFSRIGFRAIMVPFILVFAFYFFFRNLSNDKKSIWDFLIAGIFFGLGFYTYISFKIAPLIFIILFGYFLFKKDGREIIKKYWKGIVLFAVTCALIALPMLLFLLKASGDAAMRTGQVSIFNPEINKGNLLGLLLKTKLLSLGMFNFFGDPNWRHNFSGLPMLNLIVGIFFLIGFVALIKKLFQKNTFWEKVPALLVLSTFFVMQIPAILTEEGMPHSLRAIGAMLPAYILAGVGAKYLFDFIQKKTKSFAKSFFMALLIIIFASDLALYFMIWAKRPEVIDQFTTRYVEISKYLNAMPDTYDKYVVINEPGTIVDGFPVQAQTIKFLTYGQSSVTFLNPEDVSKIKIKRQTIVADLKNDKALQGSLAKNITTKEINASSITTSRQSTGFVVYFIK